MHVGNYIGLVHQSEKDMAEALRQVASHHGDEPDIEQMCVLLATWCDENIEKLQPFIARYSENKGNEPDDMKRALFSKPRKGPLALLRDLHDLWLMANEVMLCWTVILQAAKALHDKELESACQEMMVQTKRQVSWLMTRVKQAAPQTLVVAE